jgi:hypothetical protein
MGRTTRDPAKVRQRAVHLIESCRPPPRRAGACTRRPPKQRGEGPSMNWWA